MIRKLLIFSLFIVNIILTTSCGNKAIDEQTDNSIFENQPEVIITDKEKLKELGESLMAAVINEDDNIIKSILKKGANPNYLSSEGHTPLSLAVEYGYFSITRLLLQKGANPNQPNSKKQYPLTIAVKNKSRTILLLLLASSADIDIKERRGNTPLALALKSNQKSIAIDLILRKAKLNNIDKRNRSAFTIARRENAQEIVQLIRDIKKINNMGLKTSHIRDIVKDNRISSFEYIKRNIKIKPDLKKSNLIYEALNVNFESARYFFVTELIKLGFSLKGSNGEKIPLNYTVKKNDYTYTEKLLKNGADPNQINVENKTAILYAVRDLNPELVELLLNYKANRKYRNSQGYTVDACRFLPFRSGFFARRRSEEEKNKRREIINLLDC